MTLCGIRFRGSWHSWHGAPPRPRHHGPARACCGTEALPGPCIDTRLQFSVHCDLLKPAAGPLVRPPPRPRCLLRHAALCQWHALLRPSVPLLYLFPSAPLLRCPYIPLCYVDPQSPSTAAALPLPVPVPLCRAVPLSCPCAPPLFPFLLLCSFDPQSPSAADAAPRCPHCPSLPRYNNGASQPRSPQGGFSPHLLLPPE